MQATESRVKKTLLNARVNLIFYFLTLCLSFFSRKIFLNCLGADFVGLTGTLQNLLGFLNLAELGIGSAIGYLLYKPLFDKDQTKINEIISVMGYLYRWIGVIILAAGCVLACFLPLIFPDRNTGFHLSLIYSAYFAFLGSSLIGYFINYRQNLLGADQKNYVVTAYFQSVTIIKTLIQMALAYYTGNLYLWVAIEFSFGVIYSFILNWKINQTYPWLRSEVALGRMLFKKYPEVIKYTKQLFVHRISAFAQFQTAPFLIYSFVSLEIVAYYGNYTLIIDKLNQFLNNLSGSVGASVGNLIAEGDRNKIIKLFWELMLGRFFIVGIVLFGLLNYMNPFIELWLGDKYLLPKIILYLLVINFFISFSRSATDPFLFGYGLFYDTWAPITETIIYLFVAVIGGYYWGLKGIVLATTISTALIIGIWKPFFLFTKGFNISVLKYWKKWIVLVAIFATQLVALSKLFEYFPLWKMNTWGGLLINALTQTALFAIITALIYYLTVRDFRGFCTRVIGKFRVK